MDNFMNAEADIKYAYERASAFTISKGFNKFLDMFELINEN